MSGISIKVTAKKAPWIPENVLSNQIGLSSYNLMSHLPYENFNFWGNLQIPDYVPSLISRRATSHLTGVVDSKRAPIATFNIVGPTLIESPKSSVSVISPHDGSS